MTENKSQDNTKDEKDVEMTDTGAEEKTDTKAEETAKKFTQDEVDKLISERLKRAEAKKAGDIDAAVKKAIADYDRKAKMTEAERAAEASKERENELTKRERELAIRENTARAKEILSDHNIPTSLVKHIATADADETDENIAAFEADWSKALQAALKDAARGTAPRDARSVEDKQGGREIKHNGTQVL